MFKILVFFEIFLLDLSNQEEGPTPAYLHIPHVLPAANRIYPL
jgi:hypothetical protein